MAITPFIDSTINLDLLWDLQPSTKCRK